MRSGNTITCDKCGEDVGNGGVTEAVIVTALNADNQVENFYWCLKNCAPKVLSKAHLAAYLKETEQEKLSLHQPSA